MGKRVMRKTWFLVLTGASLAVLSGSAMASDTLPCAAGMICANKPETVTDQIQKLEPKAKTTKAENGTPTIAIDGEYYNYFIYFKDCEEGKDCAAIAFSADFTKDAAIDLAFVNKWNRNSRIAKAYIGDDGGMFLTLDVSTVGGLSKANFADWKGWWESQLSEFADFYDAESKTKSDPRKKT
jgi:hypothetical protein